MDPLSVTLTGLALHEVFTDPLVRIYRYSCLAPSAEIGEERMQPWHTVVVPERGHFCLHASGMRAVAEPNAFLFHNRGPFRSSHPLGGGDSGTAFVLPDAVLVEALRPYDPGAEDRPERPFAFPTAPSPPGAFLKLRLLGLQLKRQKEMDALGIAEAALALVSSAITLPYRLQGERERPSRSSRARRELIEGAKAVLSERFMNRLSLSDIAAELGVSAFHLCRVFKEGTHLTVHTYLTRLRLREALERMAGPPRSFSELAFSLGFSSHAHFTNAFRAEFGLPPSAFRRAVKGGPEWSRAWRAAHSLEVLRPALLARR